MDNQKTRKVRGSAIITAEDEVFFTPYRKLEEAEKPQKTVAACKIGTLSETLSVSLSRNPGLKACKTKIIDTIDSLVEVLITPLVCVVEIN